MLVIHGFHSRKYFLGKKCFLTKAQIEILSLITVFLTIPLNKLPDGSQNWIGNKMIASHCQGNAFGLFQLETTTTFYKKCWSYMDSTQENTFWEKNVSLQKHKLKFYL